MTTDTENMTAELAELALDLATDSGLRTWRAGFEPCSPNAYGGYDFRTTDDATTIRLTEDDGTIRLTVFTGGRAMLIKEQATFSAGLAHLAASYIAEALR